MSLNAFPFRMAEKRAETFPRLSGTLHGVEGGGSHDSLNHACRPSRVGKLKGRHARQTPLQTVSSPRRLGGGVWLWC